MLKFLGHFGPPSESKFRVSNILLKSFLWIHINRALYANWSYFQRCVQYGPQRPNFWAILGHKVSQNSGVWSLSREFFTGFTSVLLHMPIASAFRCVENIHRAIFGPQIIKNPGLWSFSQNFPLVSNQSWCSCQFELLLEVCWILASEAQFSCHFGPKIDHNSCLQSFSKIFPIGFTSLLFYMLSGGTFMCISMVCPKGSISGPRVKVVAALSRQSGLLCNTRVWHFMLRKYTTKYLCQFWEMISIQWNYVFLIPELDSSRLK